MKKLLSAIIIVLTVIVSAISLAACGGGNQDSGSIGGGNHNSGTDDGNQDSGSGDSNDNDNNNNTDVSYTVTWKDENGITITTTNVASGSVPSYTYTKQDSAEWHYTVSGWSAEPGGQVVAALPAVDGPVTYYAVVSKSKRKYTISFNDADGKPLFDAVTKEYGEIVNEPTDKPVKENMRFIGWCTDIGGKTPAVFPITVSENVNLYAAWVNKVDVKALLGKLLNGYKLDPYSYIPSKLLPNYVRSNVNTDITREDDYSSFVRKSDMPHNGFGEQWHMITDNLAQSQLFFNALNVVDTISATIVTAFNNYIDDNPDDTAHYDFKHGIYNVTVDCGDSDIYCVLDYNANFPIVGEQTAQIALSMNYDETGKTVRIQLGEANALKYTVTDNGYKFALKMLGVRRAMFEIERENNGNVTGHINEFLTASGITEKAISSAADFYIDADYVSAVGNKASGMVAFDGYISELYDVGTGKLLGYEVRETLSDITYNTLWFDLADISGIDSIKYDTGNKKFYVNGSTSEWTTKRVGGISLKTASRRFDIEFRTQYFYTQNEQGDIQEVAVKVPMLFVQEEVFETLAADVSDKNSGVNIAVTVSALNISKLKSDYATLVDIFITNKVEIDVQYILDYIGSAVEF